MPDDDFSDYTVKDRNYCHLPLDKKIEYLKPFNKPEMTVCEDVPEHYEYWEKNFNPNPEDCCNVRK